MLIELSAKRFLYNLLNEYFIASVDIFVGHITDVFNKVFDTGHFPDSWTYGYIIPIHKSGDVRAPDNYRGITLLSNFGNLFINISTHRVEKWFDENDILSDCQFGFRKGCSTVDAIFILQNLVEHILSQKLRLHCAFVDLRKAFDSVYRNGLWFKLFHLGIDGKILRIFKAMYSVVKSCVKHCNSFSDFFKISVGLRQGQNNSPVLFALFLEDLELLLQNRIDCGITLYELCVIIPLFADDMAIVGNSTEDLQNSLNSFFEYCQLLGLEVNTSKTKVVVFHRRGPIYPYEI